MTNKTSVPVKTPPPFPKTGVKFVVFQEFIEKCGGNAALANKRTEEVCQEFLVPMTKELKLSYCKLLKSEPGQKKVGTASVFISHAWKFLFLDVVQAIERHFQKEIYGGEEDLYIWFDLFSNNQHITGELDFQWWTETFKSAIEQFHYTVIILAPWNNPIPFKRAWCLWEIYCSIITESKFEVALSKNEHSSLIETMISDFDVIEQMISNINCELSECWKPEDRLNIFNAVRLTEGFDQINSIIMKKMHSWLLSSVQNEFEHNSRIEKDSLQYYQLLVVIGRIQYLQGNYQDAEVSFKKVYDYYEGRDDMLRNDELVQRCRCFLEACLHLAEIAFSMQAFDEVTRLFNIHHQYMANDEESLIDTEDVKLKISFMTIRLKLLIQNSNFHDSYGSLLKYYKLSIKRLTKKSILTITFMGLIGHLYYNLDEFDKSSKYFVEALNVINTNQFSNYLFAIEIKYHYCLLLQKQGNYSLSKQIMEQCHRFCRVKLGEKHPKTLLYYFMLEKSNYLMEKSRSDSENSYKAEASCQKHLSEKLPEFEEVFAENSFELLDIYRFMSSNTFQKCEEEVLQKYMNIIRFHYNRDPEKYRDEYIHVLLDLAKSQSGNTMMMRMFDLNNESSYENYQSVITILRPLLPLYRKELIGALNMFGYLTSDLLDREKIFIESSKLQKEQSELLNRSRHFLNSDIRFYLADTYYRQGKYSQWFKSHLRHVIDGGVGGTYFRDRKTQLPNLYRFYLYLCNCPIHYCCKHSGTTAESTRNPASPCSECHMMCCDFETFFAMWCCGLTQALFTFPCLIYNLFRPQFHQRSIDREEEFIEQVQVILAAENTLTFFSMKEVINKVHEIIKILDASGKFHSKVIVEEMLLSFLENFDHPSYYELSRLLDQLIRDYDLLQDFSQMENAVQRRLYLEVGKSGIYARVLVPLYFRLSYSQLQQRRYCTGISTFFNAFHVGNCFQSLRGCVMFWFPSDFIWDIPFHFCSSFCCARPVGRPFHTLRNFTLTTPETSSNCTISCFFHALLCFVPCLYPLAIAIMLDSCYQCRYGSTEGMENFRYYEEMAMRNYAQIKNLQNRISETDNDTGDDEILMFSAIRDPSFQFNSVRSLINLNPPKSMRMERFEEDLVPRSSSNFAKKKPEDLMQVLGEDDDDGNMEDDERIALKTNELISLKFTQGIVLRSHARIRQANRMLGAFVKSSYGKNAIDILELLGELNYIFLHNYPAALEYYQQVVPLRQSVQGDLHKKTLGAMFMLGECLRKTGNYTKSLQIHESLYKIYLKDHGENHELTRQSLDMLVHLYQVTFQFKKAYQYRLQYYKSIELKYEKEFSNFLHPRCCFYLGIMPLEIVLENCCCIPIVTCPVIMNDFISSSLCYDPICCKKALLESLLCPLSSLCLCLCTFRDPDGARIPGCLRREPVK